MNKNRKIGLNVMATTLALGIMVSPIAVHATENNVEPIANEVKAEANTTPSLTIKVPSEYKLVKGSKKNTVELYHTEASGITVNLLFTAEDKEDGKLDFTIENVSVGKAPNVIKQTDYDVYTEDAKGNKTSIRLVVRLVDPSFMPKEGVETLSFGGKTLSKPQSETQKEEKPVVNKPEIKFADDIVNEIQVGEELNLKKGVTVHDVEDGDLTDKMKVGGILNNEVAGTYKIVYNVEDKDGNFSALTREIKVVEKEVVGKAPVLEGVDKDLLIALNKEADYLKDVKATDEEDGDLTDKIDVDASQVDLTKKGEYEVVYRVADSDGNLTTAIRKAIVTKVGGLGEESSNPNALPKTGAIAGVSVGGLGIAGIAGAILRRRK